jgi:hypothetical protein
VEDETLIDRIQEEMENDDENREEQSAILYSVYVGVDKKTQAIIDEVFICLCGWSFKTLLERKAQSSQLR